MKLTYGAELELADIDQLKGLPEGCNWDRSDPSIMNSNGIAVDPKGKVYNFGGEVQTKPTKSIIEQVKVFENILDHFGNAKINHHTNLHIHIGIPSVDVKTNLKILKRFQKVIHTDFKSIINELEPIPVPTHENFPYSFSYNGAMKRYKRRKRSHHMFLSETRLGKQSNSKTTKDFFEMEVPFTKEGKPMWHAQARVCVNLRQLLQTNTIEFRHFPGTLSASEFRDSLKWCQEFVRCILNKKSVIKLWKHQKNRLTFPKFAKYQHDLETIYRQTCWDGSIDKKKIPENIERILVNKPKILVICLGNINRSPSIEYILKQKEYKVKSAGFKVHTKKASGKAIRYMGTQGYCMKNHVPQKINNKLCNWADLILTTTKQHREKFCKQFPIFKKKIKTFHNDIADPHMMDESSNKFIITMQKLEKETQLFLDILNEPGGKIRHMGLLW